MLTVGDLQTRRTPPPHPPHAAPRGACSPDAVATEKPSPPIAVTTAVASPGPELAISPAERASDHRGSRHLRSDSGDEFSEIERVGCEDDQQLRVGPQSRRRSFGSARASVLAAPSARPRAIDPGIDRRLVSRAPHASTRSECDSRGAARPERPNHKRTEMRRARGTTTGPDAGTGGSGVCSAAQLPL